MKLRLYWFKNVKIFTGPSYKNTLSRVSVLRPKSLCFHFFILKVPFLLPSFVWPLMTSIILRYQSPHLFYQYRVKNMGFIIFQLIFVQDSQILLLPQVQTIVTLFLDMTWCVQLLQTLRHESTQEINDFIKHCSWWFGFTLQGRFKFSSFHWHPSNE